LNRIKKDRQDVQDEKEYLPHFTLTKEILGCCFPVMKELGPGFLERVYKNALFLAMKQEGLYVEVEKPFEVKFRDKVIGRYNADLVVEKAVIVELKCCEYLLREHQAQVINYLTVAQIPVGLLVNFRHKKLEYKRLHHQEKVNFEETEEEDVLF
jgi:GxxExxY protein